MTTPRFVPAFRSFLRTDVDPGVVGAYLRLVDLVEDAGGVLRVEAVRGGPVAIVKRLTLCSRAVALRLLAVEGDGRPKVEVAIDRDGAVPVGLVALPGLERHALRLGDESREEAEQRRDQNATRSSNAEKCARYRERLRKRLSGADTSPDTDTRDTGDTVSRHRDTDTRHRVSTPERREEKTVEEKIREKKILISSGGGVSALPSLEGGVATPTPTPTPATPTPGRPTPLVVPASDPRTPRPSPSAPVGAPSGACAPPSGVGQKEVSGEGGTLDPSGEPRPVLSQRRASASVAHRPPLRFPSADPRGTLPADPTPGVATPTPPTPTPDTVTQRDAPTTSRDAVTLPDDEPEVAAPVSLGSLLGGPPGPPRARPNHPPPPLEVTWRKAVNRKNDGRESPEGGGASVAFPSSPSPVPPFPPEKTDKQCPAPSTILEVLAAHPYTTSLGLDVDWLAEDLAMASKARDPACVLAALEKGLNEVRTLKLRANPARGKLLAYARNASEADLPAEARPPRAEEKEELPEGWHFPAVVRAALERFQVAQCNGLCLDAVEAERVFLENDDGRGYKVRPMRMRRSEWVRVVLSYLRGQATRCGVYLPTELRGNDLAGLAPETCLDPTAPPVRRPPPTPDLDDERLEARELALAARNLATHLAKAGVPFPGAPVTDTGT